MNRRLLVSSSRAVAVLAAVSLAVTAFGPASADRDRSGAGGEQPARVSVEEIRGPGGVVAPIPELAWKACAYAPRLRCTRAQVPLDYDHPNGATISLRIVKRNATPRAGQRRIGSLFTNPGGPGGPAADYPGVFAHLLGPAVRQRFNVIGIDPRGVGGSAPMKCRIPERAPNGFFHAFPMTEPQIHKVLRFNAYLRKACRDGGNAIVDHMTTADTARDMDLIRQAVGEPTLSYYGISYGTYLGATYAQLFPDQVRAMITDGVLDPVEWSTGTGSTGTRIPFSTRLGSGRGAAEAMRSALDLCDQVGKQRCKFAGSSRGKWHSMTARLRRAPVHLSRGGHISYADLVGYVLGGLYSRSSYQPMMRDLEMIHTMMRSAAKTGTASRGLRAVRDRMAERVRDLPYGYGPRFSPAFEGVACADTLNPSDPRAWVRAANTSEADQPWFGRLWTWASSSCAHWPGSHADAYRKRWNKPIAAPVLIVGNSHDPATPISGARALHRDFTNSRLITLDGWGHGAIGESDCVARRFSAYLVRLELPPAGTVCRPNKGLYPR